MGCMGKYLVDKISKYVVLELFMQIPLQTFIILVQKIIHPHIPWILLDFHPFSKFMACFYPSTVSFSLSTPPDFWGVTYNNAKKTFFQPEAAIFLGFSPLSSCRGFWAKSESVGRPTKYKIQKPNTGRTLYKGFLINKKMYKISGIFCLNGESFVAKFSSNFLKRNRSSKLLKYLNLIWILLIFKPITE